MILNKFISAEIETVGLSNNHFCAVLRLGTVGIKVNEKEIYNETQIKVDPIYLNNVLSLRKVVLQRTGKLTQFTTEVIDEIWNYLYQHEGDA